MISVMKTTMLLQVQIMTIMKMEGVETAARERRRRQPRQHQALLHHLQAQHQLTHLTTVCNKGFTLTSNPLFCRRQQFYRPRLSQSVGSRKEDLLYRTQDRGRPASQTWQEWSPPSPTPTKTCSSYTAQ